jgi:hypothetical protein
VAAKVKQELVICNGLEGEAGVGDAKGVVLVGVFHGNRSLVVVDEGEDVDTLVVVGLKGIAEEVPEFESKHVLFGDKTQSLGYAVQDDVVPAVGKRLEVGEQVVDQLVERDLDPTVTGFEG